MRISPTGLRTLCPHAEYSSAPQAGSWPGVAEMTSGQSRRLTKRTRVYDNRRQSSSGDRGQSRYRTGAGRGSLEERREAGVCQYAPALGHLDGRVTPLTLDVTNAAQVRLQRLRFRNETGDPSASLSARTRLGANLLHGVQVRSDQQNLQTDFGSDVVVVSGCALNLTLSPVSR
jgi:hypothetical protein